ncbi:MAG TPA: 6,7-dimethyl-8-ribityllumazine synthase [Longimicrobiales bacterium]|nr:6,7-dimethyl-8-ribityllumazine synthase [Longimicrobiales bacterium]
MSGEGSYTSELEGGLDGSGLRIAIVRTRFHGDLTEMMTAAAVETLREHGVADDDIAVHRVPGAWELPWAARRLAGSGEIDAVIAIGCVIRGDTAHFDFVAGEAARGLMDVGLTADVPVILGLLTTETRDQAEERADPARQDKGREVALAALEMGRFDRHGDTTPGDARARPPRAPADA